MTEHPLTTQELEDAFFDLIIKHAPSEIPDININGDNANVQLNVNSPNPTQSNSINDNVFEDLIAEFKKNDTFNQLEDNS